MRILIASGIFHPEPGGPATYLHRLLPELQARGHEVTALSFGDSDLSDYPYPLRRIPRRGYLRRQWDYFRAAGKLWKGHDLVYLHTLGLPLPPKIKPRIGKIVGDIAWERARNRAWVGEDTGVDEFQTGRYAFQVELNKGLRAREAGNLDHVIVPSQYLKRMVLGWGVDEERISVIYNAMERPAIKDASQAEARHKLGLPPEVPLMITAARLAPWKGIDHILHALAFMPEVRLLVAGDGPERENLESLARRLDLGSRVIFLGQIPHEYVLRYFRAADYAILYSAYEGLPHVLLEALMVGTPVIASDKGGNPEVVQHDVNGVLVPHVDVEALAEAVEGAFQPEKLAALTANTEKGLKRFDFGQMVSETIRVLERFV